MNAKVRVLLADDEPLSRERLRGLLLKEPEVELVAECTNGVEAVAAIREHSPDLAFLDVQMPQLDGFGVLGELDPEERPAVIYVTAHDKFALKAFEVHAIDYLLKPCDQDRFQAALRHATECLRRNQTDDIHARLSALLADVRPPEQKQSDRLAIKSNGKVVFLRAEEIDWVEAADNYVSLHVGTDAHLHRETMNSMEGRLPPAKFMRISRSTIVNVERIKELQPLFHGEYAVILRNGARLTLSRTYRNKLQQLVGKAP